MFTIIATLEYKIDNNGFCKLDFIGLDEDFVNEMSSSWVRIQEERSRDSIKKIAEYEKEIEKLTTEVQKLCIEYKKSKKWYKKLTKKEYQILCQIEKCEDKIKSLVNSIEYFQNKKEYIIPTLKNKAHELLLKNNFVTISKTISDNANVEIWHKRT